MIHEVWRLLITILFPVPDAPDFLSRYLMLETTDFAQQTGLVNAIDDVFITYLRIVCYNQPIYEDVRLELDEYAGLTLGVRETGNIFHTVVRPMYDEASILIVDNDSESPCIVIKQVTNHCFAGAMVGLEQTFFCVIQGVGYVELCANISFPEITCPIEFPFDVSLSTADGTAGIIMPGVKYTFLVLIYIWFPQSRPWTMELLM